MKRIVHSAIEVEISDDGEIESARWPTLRELGKRLEAQSPLDIYRIGDEVEVLAGTDVLGGSHVEWERGTVSSREEYLDSVDGRRRVSISVRMATWNRWPTISDRDADKIRHRSKP